MQLAIEQGSFVEAKQLGQQILVLDPKNCNTYYNLMLTDAGSRNFEERTSTHCNRAENLNYQQALACVRGVEDLATLKLIRKLSEIQDEHAQMLSFLDRLDGILIGTLILTHIPVPLMGLLSKVPILFILSRFWVRYCLHPLFARSSVSPTGVNRMNEPPSIMFCPSSLWKQHSVRKCGKGIMVRSPQLVSWNQRVSRTVYDPSPLPFR